MKILVTGFDPVGGESKNPATEAVKKLPDNIKGAEIVKLEIPTVFKKSSDVIENKLKSDNFDYLLCIGQAGGRYEITPERVAINIDDARIPDNEGNQPIDEVIREDGEIAYFSELPIKAMVDYMKKGGVPAAVSNTAGTFVCNHIMYNAIYLSKKFNNLKAGFIHVPFLPEQVLDKKETPSMSLETIVKGLTLSIEAMIDYYDFDDLKLVGGKEF